MPDTPDDDLAAALPPSLTVDVQIPEPVREAPADEAVVAIAAEPVAATLPMAVGTTSIELAPDPADGASEPIDESAPAGELEPAPVPLPAVPELDAVAPARPSGTERRAARSASRSRRPGRRPRPRGFWREVVYVATLTLVNLGDSRPIRERDALDARIAAAVAGTAVVPVLSRKGGVGATTVATLLGMALAEVRSDAVLALDAHPDRGTLGDRVPRSTTASVRDVVLRAPEIGASDSLVDFVSRDASGLEVLASATDSLLGEPFDGGSFEVVADLAAARYAVVVADVGAGIAHRAAGAALGRAGSLVVVAGGGIDEARMASEALTWLDANGHGELVRRAVVALNAATLGTDLERLADIEEHFRSRVRAVVRIPYDPALAGGTLVRFAALRPFTRAAARDLAALVVDDLAGATA